MRKAGVLPPQFDEKDYNLYMIIQSLLLARLLV